MSTVGEVKFKTSFDDKGFKRGLATCLKGTDQLKSAFKGLAGVIAGALSVKALVSFGASCLELGSNLAEVQNVVENVFTTMSADLDAWAKDAKDKYGLSETYAKRYASTLGAMAEAYGYSEAEAYAQATALTGLVGDMASFYNKSTDETFNAVKAIYSGETEVLKAYGVVMTETALNEYALSQGINKTVNAMTEQEKVALRLSFVQSRMAIASGDFVATSDSWANATRVLTLNWESFKATIGQGLINVLSPVVSWLNSLMSVLQGCAEAFANFTAQLMGVSAVLGGTGGAVASEMASVAESAEATNQSIGGAGGGAKKLKGILAGFDKLNILNSKSGGGGGGGGSSISPMDLSSLQTGNAETSALGENLSAVRSVLEGLKTDFAEGFAIGLADFNFDGIKANIQSISDSIQRIFTNPTLLGSVNNFVSTLSHSLGQVAGSLTRVGGTIAETITGGIASYLRAHGAEISLWLARMFDIGSQEATIIGNLSVSLANIFQSVFGSRASQEIVSNLLNIPAQIYGTVVEIGAQIGRDLMEGFAQIVTDNEGAITNVLNGLVETISSILSTISGAVTDMGNTIRSVYSEYISPTIADISQGISDLLAVFLDFWQANVQPIMDMIAEKAQTLWDEHLSSMFSSIAGALGRMFNLLGILWKNYLEPIIAWIIKNILPVITPIIKTIVGVVMELVGIIGSAIRSIMGILSGIIDFIAGVLTGDWSRAWAGITEVFSGAWDGILGILNGIAGVFGSVFENVVNVVKNALNLGIASVETFINNIINAVNGLLGGISAVGEAVGLDGIGTIPSFSLPRLAQGGFVEANTPQLAMIGDNRHEGEIVAPESKISEAVAQGMAGLVPAIANAVASAVRGIKPNTTNDRPIQILLDGQVIYDTVTEYQGRANSRGGGRA